MAFNYSPKIVTDGLVLYLDAANQYSYVSGSTSWNDISRGRNNGTLINGPAYSSANGGSIVFDGTNDYSSIVNTPSLVTNTVTVNMWCYAKSINTFQTPFSAEPGLGSGLNGYGFRQRGDNTWWWVIGYEGSGVVVSTSLSQNTWVNLIGTYNGTTLVLYKNGIQQGTAGGAGRTVNFINNLTIGMLPSGNDLFLGNMASFQIYNRALSATEVLQNYNATKTRFGLI